MKKKHQIAKQIKPEKCTACNGSGFYDTTNSPPCTSCNGTGYFQHKET